MSAMRVSVLLCLLPLVPSQAQTFVDGPDAEPGFGHLCCQTGGALLVGGLRMTPVIAAVHGLADMPDDPETGSIIGTYIGLIGVVTLYPLGSAAGATIAGALGRQPEPKSRGPIRPTGTASADSWPWRQVRAAGPRDRHRDGHEAAERQILEGIPWGRQ